MKCNPAVATIAIDLAKTVFQVLAVDAHGNVLESHRLSRSAFIAFWHNRAPVRVVHHRPVVRHYHPGPRHGPPRWARGGYVHHYQRPIYVVNDYYGRGLRHPPRGHHWVRDDRGDMLLVAIATGLIVDMILR